MTKNCNLSKKLTVFLCVLLSVICVRGQQSVVKGNLGDSSAGKKLVRASVSLLQAKDSVLYRFTRSDGAGGFSFSNVKPGNYLLLVTVPGYADYIDKLSVTDTAGVNFGHLYLILKARLLEEVVVKQTVAAIKIKGDTTEFNADSFQVYKDANVEELLKKLPGIQVDSKGQITAYGQKVKKVLVDGEEFFGDDPTLVTQNLRADMIDKVQVYDKTSDQAAFTGVDDGVRDKTINLKIKADKKKGYFGKLQAGVGDKGFYDHQAMLNLFRNKEKIAAYGIVSATGKTGLGWDEQGTYGQSVIGDATYDETMGYYSIDGAMDDLGGWDGKFSGQGFPYATAAGLHYNNKWNDDKVNFNGNYKMLDLRVNQKSDEQSQFLLPDSTYYQNSGSRSSNYSQKNRLNGSYEVKADSTSTLKFTATGGYDHITTDNYSYTSSLDSGHVLVNDGNTHNVTAGNTRSLNGTMLWMKKLAKKGRTVSVNFTGDYKNTDASGHLNAVTDFYKNGVYSYNQITDQLKVNSSRNTNFDTKVTWTEPLFKKTSLVANYGVVVNNSRSQRNSFNMDADGKYTTLDTTYSSDYIYNVFTHRGGVSLNYGGTKLKMKIGGNVGLTSFDQQDQLHQSDKVRHFVNWYPSAAIRYAVTGQRSFGLRYSGSTKQPTIDELQPLQTNTNPLVVTVGNPLLKPTFSNTLTFQYQDYKVISQRGIWFYVSYNFSQNDISTKSVIDSAGKTTSQSVNVNGNRSLEMNLDYDFKLKKLQLSLNPFVSASIQRQVNFVNGAINVAHNSTYAGGLRISRGKAEKYDVGVRGTAYYYSNTSSVQQSFQPNYWMYKLGPDAAVFFPGKLELHTDGDFTIRQKTSVFTTNNNIFIWNAWIGKKILKDKSLLIKFSMNDILNQNTGYNRNVSANYLSTSTNSTIRRYGMLSLVWSLSGNAAKK